MKVFNTASSSTTSSHGFVNYLGSSPEKRAATFAAVFAEFPGAVIVDGTDDWYAMVQVRPETWERELGIKPLAMFHTGISGISKSGIVVSAEGFKALEDAYFNKWGADVNCIEGLRIHRDPASVKKAQQRKRKQARKAEAGRRNRLMAALDAKESMSFQSEEAFQNEFKS